MGRMWWWLDSVAHFLYCPGMLGRRMARARWYHRIHLIPGFVLAWVCDRFEARLLANSDDWTDDPTMTLAETKHILERLIIPGSGVAIAPKELPTARGSEPIGFRCDHVSMAAGGGVRLVSVSAYCGCEMTPIFGRSGL